MSKTVGYARVSTREQNLDRQIKALSQYVDSEMIVVDKASGKDFDRPGYQSLKIGIGKLAEGDTLYIKSLDRLSRNKSEMKQEIEYFRQNGIKLKVIDIPTTMLDFDNSQQWVNDMVTNILVEVLSSIAQQERETIRQRQREGIESMKTGADGKRISNRTGRAVGRPAIDYPADWTAVYSRWAARKITARQAMQMLELKPNSFYKLANRYKTEQA